MKYFFYPRIVSNLVLNGKSMEYGEKTSTMANNRLTMITGWSFSIATQCIVSRGGKTKIRFDKD